MWQKKVYVRQRYRIFLFPWKSSFLTTFRQKSSEWVKMVFFFPALFFFRPLKMSEWVKCKLFQEKKNNKKNGKKKNTSKMWKTAYFAFFDHFWPFFGDIQNFGRVSGLQTFPRKKKNCFFFLKQEKKTKFSEFEWVSERWTFPGKKIRYLWLESITSIYYIRHLMRSHKLLLI